MLFNHKKQSFADHTSDQFSYEHIRHLAYVDQLSPFAEDSPCEVIPAKPPVSDEEQKDFSSNHKDLENVTADHSCDLSGKPNLSQMTGNNSEVIWSENGKRPLRGDKTSPYSSKRLKQVDQNLQLNSYEVGFSASEEPPSAVAEDLKNGGTAAVPEDLSIEATIGWFGRSASREAGLDPPVGLPSYPSYTGYTCHTAEFDQVEEIHLPAFDYYNRKRVSIGVNHQADVPELRSCEYKKNVRDFQACASPLTPVSSSPACDELIVDGNDSDKWIGTRAMPMPDSNLLASDVAILHRTMDCSCPDEGSIRCVRQHVMEARKKLKQTSGQDRFVDLGFADMGEVVAQKWTEEEQQLFHEVVLTNPASLGKNFWDKLPWVFPSRSCKELVSYYFNVFMLWKRAEQNRLDPLHVDSDNDEWQESEDGEFAIEEEDEDEDEDSVVEYPLADQEDVADKEDNLEEAEITEEIDDVEYCDYYTLAGNSENGTCDAKGCIVRGSNLLSSMQFSRSNLHHYVEEQDNQDDSCTSYEGQHNGADSSDPVDIFDLQYGLIEDHENLHKEYRNDGLGGFTDSGLSDGHCDPKAWDMIYSCGAGKDDFLSTCNVIEEVFGKESWEK